MDIVHTCRKEFLEANHHGNEAYRLCATELLDNSEEQLLHDIAAPPTIHSISIIDSPLPAGHSLLISLLPAYSENLHWYETSDIVSCSCILCGRTFDSDEALQQHKRDAPAHAFDCTMCDRHFGSDTALVQHLRDSSIHASCFMLHASTVMTAIDPTIVRKIYSSTFETHLHMLRPTTVKVAIDRSAAKRLPTSTCGTHPSTLHPSSVRFAIDPSAAMRL